MFTRTAVTLIALVAFASFASFVTASDQDPQKTKSKPVPEVVELSGVLRRPIKWTPQLELWPTGQIKHIDVQGKLLDDVKAGTPIRVRGVVQTRLHRGGASSLFPAQWIIVLEVTEIEILNDPHDILERRDDR